MASSCRPLWLRNSIDVRLVTMPSPSIVRGDAPLAVTVSEKVPSVVVVADAEPTASRAPASGIPPFVAVTVPVIVAVCRMGDGIGTGELWPPHPPTHTNPTTPTTTHREAATSVTPTTL